MGASVAMGSGGGGGGKRRRRRHKAPIADINMTPFIDVVLCLLIIFMVAAPLMTGGVPLQLPKSAAAPLNVEKQPLEVSVKSDGGIYIGAEQVAADQVVPKLKAIATQTQGQNPPRIIVRGDTAINYGVVMQVIGSISGAGFKNLALQTLSDK